MSIPALFSVRYPELHIVPLGLADLAGLSDAIPVGIGCFPVRRMPKHQALSSLPGAPSVFQR